MLKLLSAGAVALSLIIGYAHAQERFPAVPPASYDEAQKKAAADFLATRKREVYGPFARLMHSPELMTVARSMGDYLRFKSAIGTTLSELVILVTAREWGQDYEWDVHAPIALKQGIKKEIVDAIRDGRRPTGMSDDEEMCYDFSIELHRNKRVSDVTYERVFKRFGNKGVVDIVGINGYYTFLAMAMNTDRMPISPQGKKLPRFPD
jgi:4-carboxymuconolactone decarboxylase